jgi:hypothetical protein
MLHVHLQSYVEDLTGSCPSLLSKIAHAAFHRRPDWWVKQSCMFVLNRQGCLQRVLQTNTVSLAQNNGHAAHILRPSRSKNNRHCGVVPENSTTRALHNTLCCHKLLEHTDGLVSQDHKTTDKRPSTDSAWSLGTSTRRMHVHHADAPASPGDASPELP